MAAGANQQLVASKLDVSSAGAIAMPQVDEPAPAEESQIHDGSLDIQHEDNPEESETLVLNDEPAELPEPTPIEGLSNGGKLITEPPAMGGTLTANSHPEGLDPTTDPFSFAPPQTTAPAPLLDHGPMSDTTTTEPAQPAAPGMTPPPPSWVPPAQPESPTPPANPEPESKPQTLSEIESAVHADEQAEGGLNAARDEVLKALNADTTNAPLTPTESMGAQPMMDNLNTPEPSNEPVTNDPELAALLGQPIPTLPTPPGMPQAGPAPQVTDPNAPPPVPPPIPFNFGGGSTPPAQ
jgi:hypothetical protein